jgi:hypothetical protein
VKITVQPAPTNLPGSKFQRNMANNWNELTNLHPHHYPATPNSSRHTNSKLLENHLDSALAILIQTSGISAGGVTPQARNTLVAINELVSMETASYDPTPVVGWLFSCLILSLVLCFFFPISVLIHYTWLSMALCFVNSSRRLHPGYLIRYASRLLH